MPRFAKFLGNIVLLGWGEDFFNRLFFDRSGVRVLGLNRKGLMIWLLAVKIVGFKLPSHYSH